MKLDLKINENAKINQRLIGIQLCCEVLIRFLSVSLSLFLSLFLFFTHRLVSVTSTVAHLLFIESVHSLDPQWNVSSTRKKKIILMRISNFFSRFSLFHSLKKPIGDYLYFLVMHSVEWILRNDNNIIKWNTSASIETIDHNGM